MGFSHHTVDLGNESVQNDKRLCFVMDAAKENKEGEPKSKKRKTTKKEKKAQCTIETEIRSICFDTSNLDYINTLTHWQVSAVTFGNKLDMKQLANCAALKVAWRVRTHNTMFSQSSCCVCNVFLCRMEASGSAGTKLIPLRPVCVLQGNLTVEPNQILQIM